MRHINPGHTFIFFTQAVQCLCSVRYNVIYVLYSNILSCKFYRQVALGKYNDEFVILKHIVSIFANNIVEMETTTKCRWFFLAFCFVEVISKLVMNRKHIRTTILAGSVLGRVDSHYRFFCKEKKNIFCF